jgi:hypothetical protein
MMTGLGVMVMTTDGVHMWTRQAVSLNQRNVAEGEIGMTEICMTSSVAEMHTVGSKTSVRNVSILNRSSMKVGTMTTMDPIMTNLNNIVLLKEGIMLEESSHSPKT